MIDGYTFYHSTIRNTVVAFGQLFNNIRLQRRDSSSDVIQTLKVPLSYGPKQKFLVRINQDPDLNTRSRVAVSLPRLAFEVSSISYDANRKIAATNQMKNLVGDTRMNVQYNPAPYNINLNLYVFAKNQDDGMQILEQILPFFNPDYNLSVNDVPDMNLKHDLPITIQSVNYDEIYEGNFDERTAVTWTLAFTAKANMYGPVFKQGAISKVIATAYPNLPGEYVPVAERYTAEIDPRTAEPTDTYSIIEGWEEIIE